MRAPNMIRLFLLTMAVAAAVLASTWGLRDTTRPAAAQVEPVEIFQQMIDALNRGDVDGATETFADEAALGGILLCMPVECVGKDAIRNLMDYLVAANFRFTITSSDVSGDTATGTVEVDGDHTRAAAGGPLPGSFSLEVTGDKIEDLRFAWDTADPPVAAYGASTLGNSVTVPLGPGRDSDQSPGTALLTGFGDWTSVEVTITPGPVGVPQPIHIHEGTCADLGAVAFPLQDIAGGKSGTVVDVPFSDLRTGNFAINVQKSQDETEVYVACGDIPAPAAPVVIEEGKVIVLEEGLVPVDSGFADANGARLWYEVYGEGEPLLLVPGLAGNHLGWGLQVPVYAREFKVVIFDYRGAGQSSFPEGVDLSWPLLADDLAALLDALGVDAAHVYGMSAGGNIAQELALRHPGKLRSLILGAAMPGGPHAVWPDQEASDLFNQATRGIRTRAFLELEFSPAYLDEPGPEFIKQAQLLTADYPATPLDVKAAHFAASLGHDTYDRLPGITAPTLVIHGADDRIPPAENARILAERIPGAELVLLEGARHAFLVEKRAETDAAVLDFLRRHSWEAPAPAAELPAAGSGGLLTEDRGSTAVWWYALMAVGTLLVAGGLAAFARTRSRR